MAKLSSKKKINGIVKLKIVAEKLQKSLKYWSLFKDYVPEDVKEGHFAVVAEYGEELPRRFLVPLSYLRHPRFLMLLEEAAEEYGFDRNGALSILCRPSELERILAEQWQQENSEATLSLIGIVM